MRKELYTRLREMLLDEQYGLGIKHVDLWNNNVEFLEQEAVWDRPAVFVEFAPINWEPHQRGVSYRAEPLVKLHIVTDWCGESPLTNCDADTESPLTNCDADSSVGLLELSEAIHGVIGCMDGEKFSRFDLVQTATNHNHEDIVESIDTYQCVAYRCF